MDEILESLAEGKPEALTSMKVIFESNRTPSGITSTPFLNGLGRKLGNLLKRNDEPMEVISMVWSAGGRDYKLVAISALSALLGKIPDEVFRFVSGVSSQIDNWEVCDQMALRVMAPLAVLDREKVFATLARWLRSGNKWLRRLAVATMPPYVRKRREDAQLCLDFLRDVMDEKDGEVIRAIGWALREISKGNPEAVFRFLMEFASAADRYGRKIIGQGMKKLDFLLERNG